MVALKARELNAKANLFDLQQKAEELAQQTEQARANLDTAQAAFQGALALLAAAHNAPFVQISPDFKRLMIPGVNQ